MKKKMKHFIASINCLNNKIIHYNFYMISENCQIEGS